MRIINEHNKICELVIPRRIAYEENLMLTVFQRRKWKPHCLSYLKWEKMKHFKETRCAAGFCGCYTVLAKSDKVDSEFSR